jgi:hypothetical protein
MAWESWEASEDQRGDRVVREMVARALVTTWENRSRNGSKDAVAVEIDLKFDLCITQLLCQAS